MLQFKQSVSLFFFFFFNTVQGGSNLTFKLLYGQDPLV